MDAVAGGATVQAQPSVRTSERWRTAPAAAILALFAGLLHLYLAPEHLEHPGHGQFLLIAGGLQVAWGIAFWRKPLGALWGLGVVLAGTFIALWAITRVLPAPFGHGGPGEVEVFGVLSKLAEGLTLAVLLAMALLREQSQEAIDRIRQTFLALLVVAGITAFFLYGGGLAAERAFPWLRDEEDLLEQAGLLATAPAAPLAGSAVPSALSAVEAGPALPTWRELLPLLTRSGWGPGDTSVDMVYAPPLLFQVEGVEPPASSLQRPTVIFVMSEADHEHVVGLPAQPPQVLLRVDEGQRIEPYEVTVLKEGEDHRTTQLLFPLPSGLDPGALAEEAHTLHLVMPLDSRVWSTFTWQLPLQLTREVTQPLSVGQSLSEEEPTANLATSFVEPNELLTSPLARGLTRTSISTSTEGAKSLTLQATYATPEYWAATLPADAASRYQPDRFIVLTLSETSHISTLPDEPLALSLRLDGREYQSDMAEQVATSAHHRFTLVRFPVAPPSGLRHRFMELVVPGSQSLEWHFPLSSGIASPGSAVGLTWVSVLALLGGLVAAMWPCLFQLTAFFIPALAGVGMQEASGQVAAVRRLRVVKAALFFVLGFTLVYTVAGAFIGFAAERLADSQSFGVWQRYLGIGAGIIIIALALRTAAKVRAPLVCKMPVLSKMAHSKKTANPLEMMVAGLAYAAGCMTCFGAAVVIAMVVYVGLSGSAAVGAFTLFLFSLGMGIPLVIGAAAMARILPLLFRIERFIPWLGLASSLVMVAFAVLLITGNYMVLTEWLYRLLPAVPIR